MKSIKDLAEAYARDIAEVLNIVKMSKIAETSEIAPEKLLNEEQAQRLESILSDRRVRLSKLAKQLGLQPHELLYVAVENDITTNSNWNQKLESDQVAKLRNLVESKETEEELESDLLEAHEFIDEREKEIEENWEDDYEWEEDEEIEEAEDEDEFDKHDLGDTESQEEDLGNTYSVDHLSKLLGYPLDRTISILKDVYADYYVRELEDESLFQIEKDSRVRKDLADDIKKGTLQNIIQVVYRADKNAYWMKGLSRIKLPQVSDVRFREDIAKVYQNDAPFFAKVISFNSAGIQLQIENISTFGYEKTELFCKYSNSPARYIDDNAKEELMGMQWLVKASEFPTSRRGSVEVTTQGIDLYQQMLSPNAYYAALVVNTTESGANVLVDGVVPLFIPNKYIAWKENNNAKTDLRPGNWVEVKVEENEKGRIGSIRDTIRKPWEVVDVKLPKGSEQEADIESVELEGVKVRIGEYEGFLSAANISWLEEIEDCSLVQLPFPLRVVVMGYNYRKRLLDVSLKHLEEDPWKNIDSYFSEDSVAEAIMESFLPGGAKIKVGEKKLSGYISFRDVNWGKSVDEKTFPYSPGDTFPVKVTRIDKKGRKLFCSIKALIPNPWMDLEGKKTVTGRVEKVYEDYAEVKLPGGIECRCKEVLPEELEGQDIEFQIQYLDIEAQKIALSYRKQEIAEINILALDEMFKKDRNEDNELKELEEPEEREFCEFTVKQIDSSGRVIAKYRGDDKKYDTGILLPTAVTIHNEPVNILFARQILKTKLKPHRIYEFEVVKRYKGLPYAVLALDVAEHLAIKGISFADLELLKPGKKVEVTILHNISTPYTVFVEWNSYVGFIPRHIIEESKEVDTLKTIELKVAVAPVHSEQMIRFTMPDPEEEILKEEERADRMKVIENLDSESYDLYEAVTSIPGYDIEKPDLYNNELELRYEPEKFPELHYKVTEEVVDLCSGTYFMTFMPFQDNKTAGRLFITNSDVELKADWIKGEFVVKECKFAQEGEKLITKSPGRPLRIYGDKINIVEQNSASVTPDTLTPQEIWAIYEYNRKVVPILEQMDKEFLQERGKHYLTLKELLVLEKKREDELALQIVDVSPREFKNKTGWAGGVAIIFSGEEDMFDCITSPDDSDDGVRVFFKANDGQPLVNNGEISQEAFFGNLIYEGDRRWRIEINPGSEPDIQEFQEYGIQLKRYANTKHLVRQIISIDNFVFGKNGFNIFSQIDNAKLSAPTPLDAEPYMNPHIDPNNPEDSQAKAIRMALGGSRLTLIQGPPGTGKSTVIVDVIINLVKEGKKVLVCTQSVQPIEELYNKVKGIKGIRCAYLRDQDSMEYSSTVEEKLVQMNHMRDLLTLMEDMAKGEPVSPLDYKTKLEQGKEKFDPSHREAVDIIMKEFSKKTPKEFIEALDTIKEYINALDQQDVKDFTHNDKQLQIDAVDVVFGTCIGIGVSKALRGVHFDTLILDEAGKANYAETLVPMMKADNYILVGDDLQLPPFTNRQLVEDYATMLAEEELQKKVADAEEVDYDDLKEEYNERVMDDVEKSLFGELKEKLPEENKIMLTKQFRMHPEIGNFVSKLFYGGKVESMTNAAERTIPLEGLEHPIMFFDTSKLGDEVKEHRIGTSLYNDGEINVIENDLVPILIEAKNLNKKVGIISPYGLQVNRMKERFEKYGLHKDIFTIDSIQGEEYDIVVFSFVRNTNHGSLNFIDNINRLNVAFSRARCNLIMVGHLDTLKNEKLHAEDAEQIKLIYQEIENKKVIVKSPKGAIAKLKKKYPPVSCPILEDLDTPYCTFEKCYPAPKGRFISYFEGEKMHIYNPALKSTSIWSDYKENKESFKAYLIGYNEEEKPYTMLSPMSYWLLSNPDLEKFSFTAKVSEMKGSHAVMTLQDDSKISLKVPSLLELKVGEQVRIYVNAAGGYNKKSFTIKRV